MIDIEAKRLQMKEERGLPATTPTEPREERMRQENDWNTNSQRDNPSKTYAHGEKRKREEGDDITNLFPALKASKC